MQDQTEQIKAIENANRAKARCVLRYGLVFVLFFCFVLALYLAWRVYQYRRYPISAIPANCKVITDYLNGYQVQYSAYPNVLPSEYEEILESFPYDAIYTYDKEKGVCYVTVGDYDKYLFVSKWNSRSNSWYHDR